MSDRQKQKHAKHIANYLAQTWPLSITQADLLWVLRRWSIKDKQDRVIETHDLRLITQKINTIPTGKQRAYKQALTGILFYLSSACQWQIPEQEEATIKDVNYQWFEGLLKGASHAKEIFLCYQQEKIRYFAQRQPLTPCFMALMIGFEIAPLSLHHISAILNQADAITDDIPHPRLRVTHTACGLDEPRVTHYYLPLISYRLLQDYYAQSPEPISTPYLNKVLKDWLHDHGLASNQAPMLQRRFQVSWYLRYHLPPTFIKDLAHPERHVGLPSTIIASTIKAADIYKIDWEPTKLAALSKSKSDKAWPHEILIKQPEDPHAVESPPLDTTNVLPLLLFDYTKHLMVYGGVKKSNLALPSIKTYTSLKNKLKHYPLSYVEAINEKTINAWAETVYNSLNSDIVKKTFYNFLRFLSDQEHTDEIDLTRFSAPTTPPSVSPARLSVDAFDQLIKTLIDNTCGHPLRNLMCVIAALLGFYAMLRRGEVLRLRRKDIKFTPKNGLLTVTITNTAEGRTKSSRSRKVYTTIPSQYRKFFQSLFVIKQHAAGDQPLLGFEDEKYHSRQLYYLLPVSRALRFLFGTHLNFHHFRHSGVHIFMLQMLFCISKTDSAQQGETPLEREVLSPASIATRFDYWFEGRTAREVNDAVFLDELCKQIGHTHYTTTRWSYLHDIDWLLPILSRAHSPYTRREYTHNELRYLMELKANSNDLSRRLVQLSPEYARRKLGEKRSQPVSLSDIELRETLLGKRIQPKETPHTLEHISTWHQSIHTSEQTLLGFLCKAMLKDRAFDFFALSQIWSKGSRHNIRPVNKKQRTALKNLAPVVLADDGQSLKMTLACNRKNARAFTTVFRHADWRWLKIEFSLGVNRKTQSTRQEALLKTEFAQKDEIIRIHQHPAGETTLTISFTPKATFSSQVLRYTECFLTLLQSNKDRL